MPSITAKGLVSFLRPANLDAPTEPEKELILLFNVLFPELQGDLFSFMQDKTCGCKARLIEALNRNPEQAEQLVQAIYKDLPVGRPIPEFVITKEDTVDPTTLISIAGETMTIEPDRHAYKQTLRKLFAERKVYQGIFIQFNPESWTLYFY